MTWLSFDVPFHKTLTVSSENHARKGYAAINVVLYHKANLITLYSKDAVHVAMEKDTPESRSLISQPKHHQGTPSALFSCSYVITKQLTMALSHTPRKQDVLPTHF